MTQAVIERQVLTVEQCDEVRELARVCERRKPGSSAGVASRSKELAFIDVPPWLSEALQAAFADASVAWGYEAAPVLHTLLDGCRPRCASYSKGCYFLWHKDINRDEANKIDWISCSIQLTPGDQYDGGNLEVIADGGRSPKSDAEARALLAGRVRAPREIGHAALFPSQFPHQVTPVTRGLRQSLVAWANVPRSGVDIATDEAIVADQVQWLAKFAPRQRLA